ncbi:MAG: PaaI family thioesterase [Chitinophagales bacterium]
MDILAENRGIDEQLFHNILAVSQSMPALQTMGIHITYLGPGMAGLKMTCEHNFANHMGSIHGAIICALIDNAMGYSVESLGLRCITLDLNLNYILPVKEGTEVTAAGHVLHAGKKTAVVEASVYTDTGDVAAIGRGTFYILPGSI